MNDEIKLILAKLKIVSEEQERGMYLCDKEDSKILLDYITNLQVERNMFKNSFEEMSKNYFQEQAKMKKLYKIINEAQTEQMKTGNAIVNLIESWPF